MELKIEAYQLPQPVKFNFEELKMELEAKAKEYASVVYTEDQVKLAKEDRASLNKLKKALNDERIRMEKEYMVPFNDFKAKINEIIGIIDKPVLAIDSQIKAYEQQKLEQRKADILEMFDGFEHPDWLSINQIYGMKWSNASFSMNAVRVEMGAKIDTINADVDTLSKLPEYGFEAVEAYKSTLDINKALNEAYRLADMAKAKKAYEAEKARLDIQRDEAKKAAEEVQIPGQVSFADAASFDKIAEEVQTKEKPKTWVKFEAFLTIDQARELKQFFDDRAIDFRAI